MYYKCIYKKRNKRYRKSIDAPQKPAIGEFIRINDFLYRIDYIEHNIKKTTYTTSECNIPYECDISDIFLYCTEVRDFRDKHKKHWLENVYEIKDE